MYGWRTARDCVCSCIRLPFCTQTLAAARNLLGIVINLSHLLRQAGSGQPAAGAVARLRPPCRARAAGAAHPVAVGTAGCTPADVTAAAALLLRRRRQGLPAQRASQVPGPQHAVLGAADQPVPLGVQKQALQQMVLTSFE
jgi:hypothetical protein